MISSLPGFVVRPFSLVKQQVYLNSVGYNNTIQRCFAFACSREYHLTGEILDERRIENIKTLAVLYDKNVYLYHEDLAKLERYNRGGIGYIVLHKDINDVYSVVSYTDENGQHITLFSVYHPLIQGLLTL